MKIYESEDVFEKNELISIDLQQADFIIKNHKHNFVEMVFVTGGKGFHTVNGVDFPIHRGSFLISSYGSTHSITPDGEITFYNIYIKPEFFFNEFHDKTSLVDTAFFAVYEELKTSVNSDASFTEFSGNDALIIENYIKTIYREYLAKLPGYEKLMESLFQVVLTSVIRKLLFLENPLTKVTHLSDEVLAYVTTHFNSRISSKELAEKCFYNPSYFSRMFKEAVGKSMVDYIQERRIKRACFFLKESLLSIEEIATQVGYSTPSKFYEAFKKQTGMTPLKYKKTFSK